MERGPLVYAMEQIDQSGAAIGDLSVRPNAPAIAEQRKELLGGVTILKFLGQIAERSLGDEPLYQSLISMTPLPKRATTLTFIPYYAFGNREPTPMEVWVPLRRFSEPIPAGIERKTDSK